MTTPADMIAAISAFPQAKILVIGDVCLDRFVRGTVTRISSESPIPVMVSKQESRMLGQAGNTLANLWGLGVKASLLSVIGDDREGEMVSGMVTSGGGDPSLLVKNNQSPTTIKTRYMAGHQQVFRVDTEAVHSCTPTIEAQLIAKIKECAAQFQAIILSDYGYGVLSNQVIRIAIEIGTAQNIPVLVDPRGSDLSKYSGATVVTPNRKELSEATGGGQTETDLEVVAAAEKLMQQSGIKSVVATRSQDGMSIVCATRPPLHLRTEAREVFDVSGAGDTVIATIAASLAVGASLVDASGLANIAGGIVVGKVGTTPIRAAELVERLSEHNTSIATTAVVASAGVAASITDWDSAREQVQRWQARGLKVGFTNGCFDILHAGHVNYLNAARAQCDRLVLAINTDQSVRLLKGPTRPINNEESRATVMAGLGAIDLVVYFGAEKQGDDNTAKAVIQNLKPDIYFKGGDYTIETLPEAPIVHSYGGMIKLMDVTAGHSTTGIIQKINAA